MQHPFTLTMPQSVYEDYGKDLIKQWSEQIWDMERARGFGQWFIAVRPHRDHPTDIEVVMCFDDDLTDVEPASQIAS